VAAVKAIDRPLHKMAGGRQHWPPACNITSCVGDTYCTRPHSVHCAIVFFESVGH